MQGVCKTLAKDYFPPTSTVIHNFCHNYHWKILIMEKIQGKLLVVCWAFDAFQNQLIFMHGVNTVRINKSLWFSKEIPIEMKCSK